MKWCQGDWKVLSLIEGALLFYFPWGQGFSISDWIERFFFEGICFSILTAIWPLAINTDTVQQAH